MTLWITLTLLACIVSALISVPLIRRFDNPASHQDQALEVARDQMAELERDVERDLIDTQEAALAKAEIERRILAAAKAKSTGYSLIAGRGRAVVLVAVLGAVALGSTLVYSNVGRPDLPSKPFAGATGTATTAPAPNTAPPVGGVEELIAGLVTRLNDDPGDAEGWRMLGWSYFNTERYSLAADAYGKSVELEANDPDVLSAYGETLVRAGDGLVSDKSLQAFEAALAINPVDPRARFFKGMALEQTGNTTGAIELWLDILETAPGNVEWLAGLRGRVQELAASSGYDLGDKLPDLAGNNTAILSQNTTEPGPTQADISAAQDMTTEDRQAMINGMVDQLAARLAENPDDPEGWVKLIRSRLVLGHEDAAISAYLEAADHFANSPEDQVKLNEAARELGLATQ